MQQNSNIPEVQETGFKARQNKRCQCGAQSGVIDTQICSPTPTHPWVKKRHLLTLNTKLRLQLTIRTSHDKELCLHGNRLKNYFKINQSN